MSRFLTGTRYLILIPILGLAIAALGLFMGLRAWSVKIGKVAGPSTQDRSNKEVE